MNIVATKSAVCALRSACGKRPTKKTVLLWRELNGDLEVGTVFLRQTAGKSSLLKAMAPARGSVVCATRRLQFSCTPRDSFHLRCVQWQQIGEQVHWNLEEMYPPSCQHTELRYFAYAHSLCSMRGQSASILQKWGVFSNADIQLVQCIVSSCGVAFSRQPSPAVPH